MKERKNGSRGLARVAALLLAVLTIGAGSGVASQVARASEVTAMSAQSAKIKGNNINTRKGAGTSYDSVTKLANGTEVTVTGQATDSDGKIWYQITLSDGRTAFVRNDFLELGEVIEQEPAESAESEAPAEASTDAATEGTSEAASDVPSIITPIVSDQYVAIYEEDDQGTYFWYLHDNDEGYRVKIDDLLAAARSVDDIDKIEKQNKTLRTVLIVAGVVAVVLIVVIVILIFRLRDYMYYEDDDEEEEEEPRRGSFVKRRREEDILEDEPARPARASRREPQASAGRGARDRGEEPVPRSRAARGGAQSSVRPSAQREAPQRPRESEQTRRARNVMRDDDDLEYEFLNLDDDK